MTARALVFDVQRFSVHDGPGIRTTVFFKGCPLRCAWCQNPESMRREPEGASRVVTADELLDEVLRDRPFWGSDGGVTLSGGEPTLHWQFLREFVPKCRDAGASLGLQTCGVYRHASIAPLLPLLDFVFLDLKLMDDAAHKRQTGCGNAQVLKNARLLLDAGVNVTFRMPVVPSINDDQTNLTKTVDFLSGLGHKRIELLEYHNLGEAKLERLGYPIPPLGLAPDPDAVARAAAFLSDLGLSVG